MSNEGDVTSRGSGQREVASAVTAGARAQGSRRGTLPSPCPAPRRARVYNPPPAGRSSFLLCCSFSTLFSCHTPSYKMAAKFVVLIAFLAVANAGMVRRDAPANPWEEIQKNAEAVGKTIQEQWNKLVNSKNTAEVNKAIKDNSDEVLKQLSQLSTSLQNAINDANGKAKEALETSKKNIEKAVEDLRKSHPEVEQQANKLRDQLQAAVQTGVKETEKLAKEIAANADEANKKLAPQVKKAYEDFVMQAEEVQKKIHEAATKQ
ncbi:apolipophorin-3-like [Cydia splendana]|uniref:apolipophorin-3-like n=1 Tax=Cydia splendana TaxID=1100963 RepID=UPI00213884B4